MQSDHTAIDAYNDDLLEQIFEGDAAMDAYNDELLESFYEEEDPNDDCDDYPEQENIRDWYSMGYEPGD